MILVSVLSGLWDERWALQHKVAAEGGEGEGQEPDQEKGRVGLTSPVAVAGAAPAGTPQGADEASMQNKYVQGYCVFGNFDCFALLCQFTRECFT